MREPSDQIAAVTIVQEHLCLDGAVIRVFRLELDGGSRAWLAAGERSAPKGRRELFSFLQGTTEPVAVTFRPTALEITPRRPGTPFVVRRKPRLEAIARLAELAGLVISATGDNWTVCGEDSGRFFDLSRSDRDERRRLDLLNRSWVIREIASSGNGGFVARLSGRWPPERLDAGYGPTDTEFVVSAAYSDCGRLIVHNLRYPIHIDDSDLVKAISRKGGRGSRDARWWSERLMSAIDGFGHAVDAQTAFAQVCARHNITKIERLRWDYPGPAPAATVSDLEMVASHQLIQRRGYLETREGLLHLAKVTQLLDAGKSGIRRLERWLPLFVGADHGISRVEMLGGSAPSIPWSLDGDVDLLAPVGRLVHGALMADLSMMEDAARARYNEAAARDLAARCGWERYGRRWQLLATAELADGRLALRARSVWDKIDPLVDRERPTEHVVVVASDDWSAIDLGPDDQQVEVYNGFGQADDRSALHARRILEALALRGAGEAGNDNGIAGDGDRLKDLIRDLGHYLCRTDAGFGSIVEAEAAWDRICGPAERHAIAVTDPRALNDLGPREGPQEALVAPAAPAPTTQASTGMYSSAAEKQRAYRQRRKHKMLAVGIGPGKPGRPRLHADDKAKSAAYRRRRREKAPPVSTDGPAGEN